MHVDGCRIYNVDVYLQMRISVRSLDQHSWLFVFGLFNVWYNSNKIKCLPFLIMFPYVPLNQWWTGEEQDEQPEEFETQEFEEFETEKFKSTEIKQ